jgi:hypothetical protein
MRSNGRRRDDLHPGLSALAMPTMRGIETRLRKLEAKRRPAEGEFFLVWGRSPVETEQAVAAAKAQGTVGRGDTVVRALWTGQNGGPPSRWIGSSRGDLSPAEDDALMAEMERRWEAMASAEERAAACAANHNEPPDPRIRQMTDAALVAAALGEAVP